MTECFFMKDIIKLNFDMLINIQKDLLNCEVYQRGVQYCERFDLYILQLHVLYVAEIKPCFALILKEHVKKRSSCTRFLNSLGSF